MHENPDLFLSRHQDEEILGIKRTTLHRRAISVELIPRKIRTRLGYMKTEVPHYLKTLPAVGKRD